MNDCTRQILGSLLGYLDTMVPTEPVQWEPWRIMPVIGGANNLLYRATSEYGDFAVKFTINDMRDRAGREYRGLLMLQRFGLSIAPLPILLDRTGFSQPVVVQTWLPGTVTEVPPDSDDEWHALIDHLLAIHSVNPVTAEVESPRAVMTMFDPGEGIQRIREQLDRIPVDARPSSLRSVMTKISRLSFPDWPQPQRVLVRNDPATRNFVRRPGAWASVDWENSGWGDAAHELADLVTHPTYTVVTSERWKWVIETYCAQQNDNSLLIRANTYHLLSLVWWVVRFARTLYEVPRGLDERLVAWPAQWKSETEMKYEQYVQRALAVMP